MDKKKFIEDLYETRLNTIRWVGVIKLLSADLPIKKYDFELNLIDTSFGKWFYEKLSIINLSNCETIIHDIEATLIIMHQNFLIIYDICVIHRQKTFGIKKSLTTQERKICSEHYLKVLSASDKFQKHLRTLQKIIDAQEIEEIVLPTEEEEIMTSIEESHEKSEEKKVLLSGARGAYLE